MSRQGKKVRGKKRNKPRRDGGDGQQAKDEPAVRPAETGGVAKPVKNAIKAKEQDRPKAEERKNKTAMAVHDKVIMWATVAIAGSALVTLAFTFQQGEIMRTQADITRSQLDQMTTDSMLREASARNDQRAWVGLGPSDIIHDSGRLRHLTLRFENSGKSPAMDVVIVRRGWLFPGSYKPTFEEFEKIVEREEGKETRSQGTIFPDGTGEASFKVNEGDEKEVKILSGELSLFYFGRISYRDIWGDPHETRWCLRYVPKGPNLEIYEEYNEAN